MPSRSPVPFLIARSIVSFGMFTPRALSTAARNRGLPLMSPPPSRAEIVSSLMTFVHSFDFLESEASFLCLIFDHRLCPDMVVILYHSQAGPAAVLLGREARRSPAAARRPAEETRLPPGAHRRERGRPAGRQ